MVFKPDLLSVPLSRSKTQCRRDKCSCQTTLIICWAFLCSCRPLTVCVWDRGLLRCWNHTVYRSYCACTVLREPRTQNPSEYKYTYRWVWFHVERHVLKASREAEGRGRMATVLVVIHSELINQAGKRPAVFPLSSHLWIMKWFYC